MLGLGRSKTYQMMKSGEIPSVRIGKAVRVPLQSLRAWLESKLAQDIGERQSPEARPEVSAAKRNRATSRGGSRQ
jgi:excisionase family DNA binding protein